MHAAATGQLDRRLVAVVARVEHDDFVAAVDHRLDRAEDRLGGAGVMVTSLSASTVTP
jgi:hypothetical protein